MRRIRIYKVAKMFGMTAQELCTLLLQKYGIRKNNYSSVTEQEIVNIQRALFEVDIKKVNNISYKSFNALKIKIRDIKYHDTIKFLVHMITDKTERKKILSQIAYINPYLASRILITICDDIREEKNI